MTDIEIKIGGRIKKLRRQRKRKRLVMYVVGDREINVAEDFSRALS